MNLFFPPRMRSGLRHAGSDRATRGDKSFPSVRPPHARAGLQPVLGRLPGL